MTQKERSREELVLVIEDDASLRLGLVKALRGAGFRVETAKDGEEGIEKALAEVPDLVLCDVMMPKKNGFEVCEVIRERDADVPFLFLSAKSEEIDKVFAFNLGADDYVVKPFGLAELLARVEAAMRRQRRRARESVVVMLGDVRVDFRSHRITRDDADLEATALEMKLLRFFVAHEGELLARQRILDAVWGADYFGTDRTIDNFINRLRAKIERDPKDPAHIVTVRGAGYRFSQRGR